MQLVEGSKGTRLRFSHNHDRGFKDRVLVPEERRKRAQEREGSKKKKKNEVFSVPSETRKERKKENVRNSWQSSLLLTEAAGNMFQFQPRNTFNVWTVHDSLRAQLADTNPAFWPELDISHE